MIDLGLLNAPLGFVLEGEEAGDSAGFSVELVEDINGDGIDDVIVGARHGDAFGIPDIGETYVIYGVAGTARGRIDLGDLSSEQGFVIEGDSSGDQAGFSVSSAGDFNGDGIGDLIVGAHRGDDVGFNSGEAYVVFGVAGSTRGRLDLTGLAAPEGFIIRAESSGDSAGFSVSSAGDVNGDGIDDLIVGAPYGDAGGPQSGQAYVI